MSRAASKTASPAAKPATNIQGWVRQSLNFRLSQPSLDSMASQNAVRSTPPTADAYRRGEQSFLDGLKMVAPAVPADAGVGLVRGTVLSCWLG
jgi:hypothetical protein